MRREILWASVRRVLGAEMDIDDLDDVAYMWHRQPRAVPIALLAGVFIGLLAPVFGFTVTSSVAIGAVAVAVVTTAATEYRVLAITGRGLALMRGGRIRQVAKPPVEWLPDSIGVERVSSNLVISEWRIGDRRFSVLRRFESTMAAIAAAYPP